MCAIGERSSHSRFVLTYAQLRWLVDGMGKQSRRADRAVALGSSNSNIQAPEKHQAPNFKGKPLDLVGAELVRVRSQTIYYVLTRIKGICKVYLDRQRMAQAQVA